jgi:hypothetical protein
MSSPHKVHTAPSKNCPEEDMTAFINATTAAYGVQVYQDHAQKDQFFYVPLQADLDLGTTLEDFKVDYWGINAPFYSGGGGEIRSLFGAILAGRANIDISAYQRRKIVEQIQNDFSVDTPKLAPLRLRRVEVQPVFASNTLGFGENSDTVWPTDFQFGSSFNYLLGTGNALFASYVAAQGDGVDPITNPGFGVNIAGKAEFRGEPWKCHIKVDLSSFWKEVRIRVAGSARFGWFKVGSAEFNKVVKELERDKIIQINFESGSLDLEKYGAQIFEMGKAVAEAINAGQGGDFFKFQPNPDQVEGAREADAMPRLFGLSPWSVSINASYSEQSFTQNITYEQTLSYEGNFEASVPSSMTLAVICNNATKQYFNELGSSEPCVTPQKVSNLQTRLETAVRVRNRELKKIRDLLSANQITVEVYNVLKADIEKNVESYARLTDVRALSFEPARVLGGELFAPAA